jgi:hypothetical protein
VERNLQRGLKTFWVVSCRCLPLLSFPFPFPLSFLFVR